MIIGYARVSTDGQTLDNQQAALTAAGADRVYSEKVSGAVTDRKALAKAILALGPGDVLLVTAPRSAGAVNPRSAQYRPYSGCNVILLWLTRGQGWATPRFITFKQGQEAGGSVRKGEHGTKVYFVKQLRVTEGEGEDKAERLVPMMREYTVFNVAQCEGLPASIVDGKPARVRNKGTRREIRTAPD